MNKKAVDANAPIRIAVPEASSGGPIAPRPSAANTSLDRRTSDDTVRRPRTALPAADDIAGWTRVGDDSALATHLYGTCELPPGWHVDAALTEAVRRATGIWHVGEDVIGTKRSGLHVRIFRNMAKHEIVVSFYRATGGDRPAAGIVRRGFRNKRATVAQLAHALVSRFFVPRDYAQAAAVLRCVLALAAQDEAQPAVRVVAHSKGGQEAQFAASVQETFVQVDAFSAPPLSRGVIAAASIPQDRREEMQREHTIGFVEGDYTRRRLFNAFWSRAPDIGQVYVIPADLTLRRGGLNRHDDVHAHAAAALERARALTAARAPAEAPSTPPATRRPDTP